MPCIALPVFYAVVTQPRVHYRLTAIDSVLSELQRYTRAGAQASVPEDLQQQAIRRFWDSRRLDSLKEARLVSLVCVYPFDPQVLA